jgi:sodium pump decarboxylase gamma subunit
MNISQLLEALKDTSSALSLSDKLLAGVSVAILSMGVVFIVLVIIALIIAILQIDRSNKKQEVIQTENAKESMIEENQSSDNDNTEELVSIITAAIAAATGNSTNNIIVRKIQRSNNNQTSWERMAKKTIK